MDFKEELVDVLEIYKGKLEKLSELEDNVLDHLIIFMKRFIDIHEQRETVQYKLETLMDKIEVGIGGDIEAGIEGEGNE